MLALMLLGLAQSAYPDTGSDCADAPARLRQHLVSHDLQERLHALRGFMQQAIERSEHALHDLVGDLFADPLALAGMSITQGRLLPEATPLELSTSDKSPLDAVTNRLKRIHDQLEIALSRVSKDQADRLRRLLPALLERTATGSDLEELEHGAVLAEIQAALDRTALEKAAALLAGLARPEVAAALDEHFGGQPSVTTPDWLSAHVTGDILHADRTEHGAIVVGGAGANVYTGPAAVIIDIGGDDVYALPADDPIRIIIDLEGDDNYTAQTDSTLAGAVLGASLIADHAGSDTYAGGRITQGAAVAGIGMLHDLAGNDRYFAAELAQGAALAGIGILLDAGGDDLYTAARFSQGFGGALGIGSLADGSGNDIYFAGNRHASSYGVAGNYQAFSQGVGMGFRDDIAGGIGLLHDRAGNDRYTAGNYSQGTGYYLGAGLLFDQAGNDAYSGGRYTQGAAAHLGIGLLREAAGNDSYTAGPSASQGGAWDQAVAGLIEAAGDDQYTINEFGLGASAENAIAFLIDAAGENTFTARRDSQGHDGPTGYHEGGEAIGNLALFITGKCPTSKASD